MCRMRPCASVCSCSAIANEKRPCEKGLAKIKAISMGEDGAASIDNETCTSCGACVYQLPLWRYYGQSSFILDVGGPDQKERRQPNYKAPCGSALYFSQFSYAKLGQVISGIKSLVFHSCRGSLGSRYGGYLESQEQRKGISYKLLLPCFLSVILRRSFRS